jgi:hypothetical protein
MPPQHGESTVKNSTRRAGPSRKSRASAEAARRAVIDEVIRESIALYHQAQRALARFEEASAGDRDLDDVQEVVVQRLGDAETNLIRAILAPSRRRGDVRPETHLYPPRGVRCDGLLYLVRPLSDDSCDLAAGDADPAAGERERMFLTVVDEDHVADVGTIVGRPVYEPDPSPLEPVEDPDAGGPRPAAD